MIWGWESFIWTTLGIGLTLMTFSFLYRDNPFYKFSEHLFVGVSAGYWVILLWYTGLIPKLITPINAGRWWYFIPGILGLLMWFRFSRKMSWISRYPIAFYLGIGTGASIPLEMQNRIFRQILPMIKAPDFSAHLWSAVWTVFVVVGVICGLSYFFFSKAHKGTFGLIAKIGIYILMVGFGASFGLTAMGRISLFVQRVQAIRDWVKFGNTGGIHSQLVIWAVVLVIILAVLYELIKHLRNKSTEAVKS